MGFDRVDKNTIGDVIRGHAKRTGGCPRVIVGMMNDDAKNAHKAGEDFLYIDHAYFKRGWHNGNFRAVRNEVHLTHIVPRPTDRLKQYEVVISPWKKTGKEIVIVPPSERQMVLYEAKDWLLQMESKLSTLTSRPVVVKNQKSTTMRDFCRDTWAVVTLASVAGVEAALLGIPVFSTNRCPSWPVSAGPIEKIDEPTYSDARLEWASSLSYATWSTRELRQIKWHDYHYERLS